MKRTKTFALLAVCAAMMSGGTALNAQSSATGNATSQRVQDAEVPQRFWTANLPGGTYMVALDRIASVAKQNYVLDNSLVIYEVTVETTGAALARFYYITPMASNSGANIAKNTVQRANELLNMASNRAGAGNADELVIKQYPTTSHAKTIEYRLAAPQEVDALFSSLQKAWSSGRGRNFNIK